MGAHLAEHELKELGSSSCSLPAWGELHESQNCAAGIFLSSPLDCTVSIREGREGRKEGGGKLEREKREGEGRGEGREGEGKREEGREREETRELVQPDTIPSFMSKPQRF